MIARDLTEPSPLALEVLSARPYAYLDDAPLEERRTQAVMSRRWLAPEAAGDIGRLDPEAIARVQGEAWPDPANTDELHDALVWLGFLAADEAQRPEWSGWFDQLARDRRAAAVTRPPPVANPASAVMAGLDPAIHASDAASVFGEKAWITGSSPVMTNENGASGTAARAAARLWVAAERLPQFLALWPDATLDPPIAAPAAYADRVWSPDEALVEILRGRLEGLGPVSEERLAEPLGLTPKDIAPALAALEAEGFAMRGRFTPGDDRRGMVRTPAAGAHSPLHRQAPARRDRAGRGARLPALSAGLAAGHARYAHGRAGRARRRRRVSSKASRRRPAPGRPRSCRRASPTTSRHGSTINVYRGASPGHGCGRAMHAPTAASAARRRCGPRRSFCWRAVTPGCGRHCRQLTSRPARARGGRWSPIISGNMARRSSMNWSKAPGFCARRSRRRSPSWWRSGSSTPTVLPGCARCWCRPTGAAREPEDGVGAPRCSAWTMPAAGRSPAVPPPQPVRARSGRACRPHPFAALRRRVLARARARGWLAAAVARSVARLSPAGGARRDPRRPLCRRFLRRAIRACRTRSECCAKFAASRVRATGFRSPAPTRSTSSAS